MANQNTKLFATKVKELVSLTAKKDSLISEILSECQIQVFRDGNADKVLFLMQHVAEQDKLDKKTWSNATVTLWNYIAWTLPVRVKSTGSVGVAKDGIDATESAERLKVPFSQWKKPKGETTTPKSPYRLYGSKKAAGEGEEELSAQEYAFILESLRAYRSDPAAAQTNPRAELTAQLNAAKDEITSLKSVLDRQQQQLAARDAQIKQLTK